MILGLGKLVLGLVVAGALVAGGYLLAERVLDLRESDSSEPTGKGMVVRALGDSVTAGFGYHDDDGAELELGELPFCLLHAALEICQDPDGIAYPARFSARVPDVNFRSFAVSGSTAADWLGEGNRDLRPALAAIVAADPDLTVLTLGANPLLRSFIAGTERFCAMTRNAEKARRCVREALDEQRVQPRLEQIYGQLLKTPRDGRNGTVVVFQYPETHPASASGLNIAVLVKELRDTVAGAVAGARAANPERGKRLVEAEPGPFLAHGCHAERPWILEVDSCIHPNAAGHRQLAAALASAIEEGGQASATLPAVAPATPERFAEPGTSCGVVADPGGRWPQATALQFAVTDGRFACAEIEAIFAAYVDREPTCTIANGADSCTLDVEGWACQRAPGVWMWPANFSCDDDGDPGYAPDIVGLYPEQTTPTTFEYACGNSGEGGGPVDVEANFDCEAAMHVAMSIDHKFGFLCHSEKTGIESSHTVCTLDAARLEWTNGA